MIDLEKDLLRRVEILERRVGQIGDLQDYRCEACGYALTDVDGAHRCSGTYSLEKDETEARKDYICRFCNEGIYFHETYKHWGGLCSPHGTGEKPA
jgi:transposase-like protein